MIFNEKQDIEIKLRPANINDWARLYAWRNDPDCAKQFFKGYVTLVEHWHWLGLALINVDSHVYIAETLVSKIAIGTIRTFADTKGTHISIMVDNRYRRYGFAKQMIKLLQSIEKQILVADIKPTNVISLIVFASCGFKPIKFMKDRVVLEWRP